MSEFFSQLSYGHWWILAVLLIILEVFSPAAFFMWLGAAAGVTGLALLIAPDINWPAQLIIFSVLSVASVWLGRSWFGRHPIDSDQPFLNEQNAELIGRVCEVEHAIKNGSGRVIVGDSTWKAIGADAAIGEKVRVIAVDAAVLKVERIP